MQNQLEGEWDFLNFSEIKRRQFLKLMASAGIIATIGTSCSSFSTSKAQGKIIIIGGGAAGLSVAARLMNILEKPDVTLVDPSDKQFYQPGFTFIASGVYQPKDVWKKQENCIPKGVKWIKDSVTAVDPIHQKVTTSANGILGYDYLVLTPGLQMNWDKIEGISYQTLGEGNAYCMYDFEGAQKTWIGLQKFVEKGGRGIYTDTYTKHKCGGAPKKLCLLTEHLSRKKGKREKLQLDYYTASHELYDVPYFTPRLQEIYDKRKINLNLNTRITGIDTSAQKVYFDRIEKSTKEVLDETTGKKIEVEEKLITPLVEEYDFLHFLPPMSAPNFVRDAELGWTEGKLAAESWVMVDKETLIHKNYSNIISLGDVAGIPTSKTSAAIRMQAPIAVKNLIALMEGRSPEAKYDGYAACPIVTDYGHVLLCEFDYNKKEKISFPFTLLDMSKEQWAAWILKKYILKPAYFYGMLNGWM